jgi:hypothetical protein
MMRTEAPNDVVLDSGYARGGLPTGCDTKTVNSVQHFRRVVYCYSEQTPLLVALKCLDQSAAENPGFDQADSPFEDSIAFFTALQIVSREKGSARKSNIRNFSALNLTALGSYSKKK